MKLSDEEFEELVNRGIAKIPQRFLDKLNNVAIVIADRVTIAQKKKQGLGQRDELLGLYEGVPQTHRWGYNAALPDKITIFKIPIEQMARTKEQVEAIVRDTVWHEIAHHFGMDEHEVRRAEKKRRV